MQLDNIILIAAVEIGAVLLAFCVVLFIQNRSLRKLVKKLKARMTEIVEKARTAREEAPPPPPPPVVEEAAPQKTFLDFIEEQIEATRAYHNGLDPDQDIVLDLSPDVDIPRRAAALRYTVFLTEKEAISAGELTGEDVDWSLIRKKYQQIFDFYEDYVAEAPSGADSEQLQQLTDELTNAKKRINNLEKFKTLYFELEEKWDASRKEAKTHYDDLSAMASEMEDSDKFEQTLASYNAAYNNIDTIISSGIDQYSSILDESKLSNEATSGELKHLRMVAADQHKLINELQEKLKNANNDEERNNIVDGLKGELEKQKRFMQESDTCIQLMEEELSTALREVDQLKGRLKSLPSLKEQLHETRKQKDEYELKVYALTSENRKLNKKLKEDASSISVDDGEATRLKRELTDLESRYASLEEKYLDLKLNQ